MSRVLCVPVELLQRHLQWRFGGGSVAPTTYVGALRYNPRSRAAHRSLCAVPWYMALHSGSIQMPTDAPQTLSLARFSALLAALRDGPLKRHDLIARLGDAYPRTASARPMIDRDVKRLAELGIVILISRTRRSIPCVVVRRPSTRRGGGGVGRGRGIGTT
jgi:hypothetical protein